jgi:hypothetical protein
VQGFRTDYHDVGAAGLRPLLGAQAAQAEEQTEEQCQAAFEASLTASEKRRRASVAWQPTNCSSQAHSDLTLSDHFPDLVRNVFRAAVAAAQQHEQLASPPRPPTRDIGDGGGGGGGGGDGGGGGGGGGKPPKLVRNASNDVLAYIEANPTQHRILDRCCHDVLSGEDALTKVRNMAKHFADQHGEISEDDFVRMFCL